MKNVLALTFVLLAALAGSVRGEEGPDIKQAARSLAMATVTVRVAYSPPREGDQAAEGEAAAAATASRVVVCSGILVAESIIATHVYISPDSLVRVTLPAGEQAAARLIAIDEYSGIALLKIERQLKVVPPWNTATMEAGQWVVSSAAWGAEDPVISLGVVSAAERSIRGASFPPLIECDMRAADTSSGAGVVNQRGEVVGIVAAVETTQQRGGWTYVVPISHVSRLLRAWESREAEHDVLVLKRRRPVVGMVLTMDAGAVVAQRVADDGPASKAGIAQGDVILAVDGVKIRSVYDVQRPVLHRQPGDEVRLMIGRGNEVREAKVVLGGGVVLPANLQLQDFSRWVRPKYDVEQLADGRIVSRNARGDIRELAVRPAAESDAITEPAEPAMSLEEKLQLLERALDRYQRVIALQQAEIDRRGKQQQELESQLRALQEEVGSLRSELQPQPAR